MKSNKTIARMRYLKWLLYQHVELTHVIDEYMYLYNLCIQLILHTYKAF